MTDRPGAKEIDTVRGALAFAGVSFRYPDAAPDELPLLHDIDLRIPAGQIVALVGETGAGKTTMARLMARFYDPTAGRMTLDGVDLRSIATEELRRAVVTVTQESFLFSGNVGDNLKFGRPIWLKAGAPMDFSAFEGQKDDQAALRQVTDTIMNGLAGLVNDLLSRYPKGW